MGESLMLTVTRVRINPSTGPGTGYSMSSPGEALADARFEIAAH